MYGLHNYFNTIMTSFNIVCPRPEGLFDYSEDEDVPTISSIENEMVASVLPTTSFNYSSNNTLKDKFKMKFTKMFNSIVKSSRFSITNEITCSITYLFPISVDLPATTGKDSDRKDRGTKAPLISDYGPPKHDLSSNVWSLIVASRIAIEELGSFYY